MLQTKIETSDQDIAIINSFADAPSYKVAVVEDEAGDFFLLRLLLEQSGDVVKSLTRYDSVDALLKDRSEDYDLIILDRFIASSTATKERSRSGLTESRIRPIKAACSNASVVMYTSHVTPSLRSSAAHEGAFAVVEKGSLTGPEMGTLLKTAAMIGQQITNPV